MRRRGLRQFHSLRKVYRMKASNRFLESAWSREDGQTVVLAALCMTLLMGFLALSVDVGLLFCAKRSAQTAADAAAIAGAQEIAYSDVVTAARADASRNGFTNGTNGVAVAVNNPPLNGPHAGNSGYVEVIVSASETTFFLNLFNQGTMTVEARAVSTMGATQNCVYALGSSGTDISVTNGVNVQFPSCALYGDSSGSTDLNVSGGATLNAAAIALVGNYSNTGGSHGHRDHQRPACVPSYALVQHLLVRSESQPGRRGHLYYWPGIGWNHLLQRTDDLQRRHCYVETRLLYCERGLLAGGWRIGLWIGGNYLLSAGRLRFTLKWN